jgi:hypothetical protein
VYLLPVVPTGTVTLRATRVGYGPAELAGTVRVGSTLTLNFVLMDQRPAARQLAEEKVAAKAAANSPLASGMLRREDFRTNGVTGVAASSGSACQSGAVTPSHVLSAIGVAPDLASAAIRLSLGTLTTEACIARVAQLFPALIAKARRLSGTAG